LALPGAIAHLVAEKGSIALDGVSLTVNGTGKDTFGVVLIPHTGTVTTFGDLKAGDKVNVEADVFARYSARLQELKGNP
ncbi:MAG: riboflavin synthase, partial [Proteobacteria bacterium]|nr:riboflavin synthase [Pseudomonadota bacterium]